MGNGLKEIALQCRNIADSCENQADAIEKARQDLIREAIEAVAISTVIQGIGAAFAPITLGMDEAVAQPLQAVEIANLSSRVTAVLDVLTTATRIAVGMLEDALATVSSGLRFILSKVPIIGDSRSASKAFKTASEQAWTKSPVVRGSELDELLGNNLDHWFPTIDRWERGVATSIKSLDLNASPYQSESRLKSTLKGYVDKLGEFEGADYKGNQVGLEDIGERVLEVAVNKKPSSMQLEVFQAIDEYAKMKARYPVKIKVKVIP